MIVSVTPKYSQECHWQLHLELDLGGMTQHENGYQHRQKEKRLAYGKNHGGSLSTSI